MGTATGIISKANRAVTAATTIVGNEVVLVDATSAAATVTGPAAATARRWGVKKTDASTNAVTISYLNAAGTTATLTLAVQDDAKTFEPVAAGYAAVGADRSRAGDDGRYASTTATTKRVTLPFGGAGAGGNFTTVVDSAQRHAITLPVTTTRWRIRYRNQDCAANAVYAYAMHIAGVWFGAPVLTAAAWNGSFTAAPTLAVAAATTPADGSDWASGWVTDPTLQFPAHTTKAISVGLDSAGATVKIPVGRTGPYSTNTTVAGAAAAAGSQAIPSGMASGTYAVIGDFRIEYEYVGPQPVGLFIGDSIVEGVFDTNNGPANYGVPGTSDTWPAKAGLLGDFAWITNGVGGRSANSPCFISNTTGLAMTRLDLATTVPDFAVISFGINDATSITGLSTFQANIINLISNARALGIKRVFVTTVPALNNLWPGTRLVAAAASGATTIVTEDSTLGAGSVKLELPNTTKQEAVTITGTASGTGPYTYALSAATTKAHSIGTPVLGNLGIQLVQAYNDWLRGCPAGVDGCIDHASVMEKPGYPHMGDPRYYQDGDGNVHPGPQGYTRMAQEFRVINASSFYGR